MADSALGESLAALSRFVVGDGPLEQTLTCVADLTVVAPVAEMVGITMPVEGRHRTAIFTDEAAPAIDQAQYDTGEGPGLEAFEVRQVRRKQHRSLSTPDRPTPVRTRTQFQAPRPPGGTHSQHDRAAQRGRLERWRCRLFTGASCTSVEVATLGAGRFSALPSLLVPLLPDIAVVG
jgi:hypothetical protein